MLSACYHLLVTRTNCAALPVRTNLRVTPGSAAFNLEKNNMPTKKTAGPFPLRLQAPIAGMGVYVIVTNQGNHFATTYDPLAARLIAAISSSAQEKKT